MRQAKNSNYVKYRDIGIEVSNGGFSRSFIWELLVKEGFWKLILSDERNETGSEWKNFIQALDGFSSAFFQFDFLALIISHACSIYLILKNDQIENRKLYFSNLVAGRSILTYEEKLDWINKKLINKSLVFNLGMFERYLYSIVSSSVALEMVNKSNLLSGNIQIKNKLKKSKNMLNSGLNSII